MRALTEPQEATLRWLLQAHRAKQSAADRATQPTLLALQRRGLVEQGYERPFGTVWKLTAAGVQAAETCWQRWVECKGYLRGGPRWRKPAMPSPSANALQ